MYYLNTHGMTNSFVAFSLLQPLWL